MTYTKTYAIKHLLKKAGGEKYCLKLLLLLENLCYSSQQLEKFQSQFYVITVKKLVIFIYHNSSILRISQKNSNNMPDMQN